MRPIAISSILGEFAKKFNEAVKLLSRRLKAGRRQGGTKASAALPPLTRYFAFARLNRRMSPQRKLTLTLIVFAVLLVASLAGLYLYRSITELSQQFRERAEFLALAFADRAALYLAQNQHKDLELLTQTVVLGSVLYAQIVSEGRVMAHAQNPAIDIELPVENFSMPLQVSNKELSKGRVAYLDIARALTLPHTPSAPNYARVGVSLEPLKAEIRAQVLIVLGVSFGFIFAFGLLVAYLSKAFFAAQKQPELAAEPARPISSLVTASQQQSEASATSSTAQAAPTARTLGELIIDDTSKKVQVRGRPLELSPKEYELLKLLASSPGHVFSNSEILERVWPKGGFATAQDVKQYVYFLRQKLEENPEEPKLIITVRGFGYKLQI